MTVLLVFIAQLEDEIDPRRSDAVGPNTETPGGFEDESPSDITIGDGDLLSTESHCGLGVGSGPPARPRP